MCMFSLHQVLGREVEYLALSRDTTEADLKQRREIVSGTAHYIDQVLKLHRRADVLPVQRHERVRRDGGDVLEVLGQLGRHVDLETQKKKDAEWKAAMSKQLSSK